MKCSFSINKPHTFGFWELGFTALFTLACTHTSFAQSRYLTAGTGATPMSLSGDYRSLGWNPGQLTFSPLLTDEWKSAAGGLEFGARISSSVLEREDVWDGILGRNTDESANWSQEDWSDYVELLSNSTLAVNADVVSAASAKRWRSWGFAYSNTQHFQAEAFFGGNTMALLVQGNSPQWLSLFDAFITATGDTISNDGTQTAEEMSNAISGINFDADALLSEVLGDTRLGFSWYRSHCIGLAKAWELGDVILHTGLSGRLLLGNGYFAVQNTEEGLDAFGAFSNGFNVARIAALTNGLPTEFDQVRTWGPVGQGWGVDIGGVVEWKDMAWASASVTDIGSMEWRGESYSVNNALTNWNSPVVNPSSIADIVIGAMDPGTWFEEADYEIRRVPLGATFHLGGGVYVGDFMLLAAEAAFDNPELIGNAGARFGASAILRPVRFFQADIGLSKWGDETTRVPAGLMVKTGKKGFECGIQATDIQALWRLSQPEVGFRMVAMRWVW